VTPLQMLPGMNCSNMLIQFQKVYSALGMADRDMLLRLSVSIVVCSQKICENISYESTSNGKLMTLCS
jgi:hypothetical protein